MSESTSSSVAIMTQDEADALLAALFALETIRDRNSVQAHHTDKNTRRHAAVAASSYVAKDVLYNALNVAYTGADSDPAGDAIRRWLDR